MKKLLKYLKPYIKECITAPSFKMLEAFFELFVPIVMSRIIDEGIVAKNTSIIYRNGIILALLALIGLTCALFAQFFAAKAAIGFSKGLRSDLYKKIIGFSYENIDTIGTASLITRITNDINQVQNGVNLVLRLLLRSPFIVFGAMIMAFTINVKAALIFVVMIPLLFVAVFVITLVTIPMYKRVQKSLDKLTGHIRENLAGARVVRAFSAADRERNEFNKENDNLFEITKVTARISALLNPLTLLIVNVAMLILIANGARFVNNGLLTSGEVYALVNYMSQILVELVKLANLIITINKSLASASRISDTMEIKNALKDSGTLDALSYNPSGFVQDNPSGSLQDTSSVSIQDTPLLEIKNASFTYPKADKEFIQDISFSVNKGQTIGIIGGTGSGKTTLINLLMRFYDLSGGSILYKGTDIKEFTLNSLRDVFSLVPQKAQLFSGSLRDNLLLANPNASDERLYQAVELACAADIVKAKGQGLDFKILEGGANLSGGQKQRLTIARALVSDSPILILDDSSSALDYATDSRLRANLKNLPDKTVIIISQRVISIKEADKILVLDDGKLVGTGTHDELLNSSDIYKEIVMSQEKGGASL